VARALVNKGVRLGELGRLEEEIAAFDEVVVRFGGAAEPGLRELVARALFDRGVRLGELGRLEEAIAAFDEVVVRFGGAAEPCLREQVAGALLGKGAALDDLGESAEAITVYDEVVQRLGEAAEPLLREIAGLGLGAAVHCRIRSAKRAWSEGRESEARQLLSDAKALVRRAPDRESIQANVLAAAGYAAFLLDDEAEAKAHSSDALRLNAEEARAYFLELAEFQPMPKDEQFKSWVETLSG
jgi:tetratricopeptide (TPR) repeat protein